MAQCPESETNNKLLMPTKKRFWRHYWAQVFKPGTTKDFRILRQATALGLRKSDSLVGQLFAKNPVLLLEVADGRCLEWH